MSRTVEDLIITDSEGVEFGYMFDPYAEPSVQHIAVSPNVPLNVGSATPTSGEGQFDVRDTEGDKAVSHLDWSLGAGQKSLDEANASASRYLDSSCIDNSTKGLINLFRSTTTSASTTYTGPLFSACGRLWMGGPSGGVKTSTDNGANWTACTGITSSTVATSFATDGTKVYVSFAVGSTFTIYANTASSPTVFAKFGGTGTSDAIRHLAYSGGYLFAATAAGAGIVDSTSGVYTKKTPNFLNTTNTSIGLVAAGNSVFWVVSQGAKTFVYELRYDPSDLTVTTEQFMEMPSGFIGTCALGYLSMVYVGGYWDSSYTGVGKGAIYVGSSGYAAPLFEIGETPEQTALPTATENDNRVHALTAAGKDLYVLTNRACYRWDIDQGGYSHLFDFPGVGVTSTVSTSPVYMTSYQWDGTDKAGVAPSYNFPAGYTREQAAGGAGSGAEAVWSYASGKAKWHMNASNGERAQGIHFTSAPTGNDALSNANGTRVTVQLGSGTKIAQYNPDSHIPYLMLIDDGTRSIRAHVCQWWAGYGQCYWYAQAWGGGVGQSIGIFGDSYTTHGLARTLTVTLRGNHVDLQFDSQTASSDTITAATLGQVGVTHSFNCAYDSSKASDEVACEIDSIAINNSPFAATTPVATGTFAPSLAFFKGNLSAPYAQTSAGGGTTIGFITTSATARAASGWLQQSPWSFHTGSLLKDYRYIDVVHEPLPAGSALAMDWWIDGVQGTANPYAVSENKTRFYVNAQGCLITTRLTMTRGTVTSLSPQVRSVNVIWNFVKNKRHLYALDCRAGAKSGRWRHDPEAAINFLMGTASKRATFADRFSGSYAGSIESIEYTEAPASNAEKAGGKVRLLVREEA